MNALATMVLTTRIDEHVVRERQRAIHDCLLAQAKDVRAVNFSAIHPRDIAQLVALYDQHFFAGHCRQTLGTTPLHFRLSTRMSKAGAKTTRYRTHTGEVLYEIAISCGLLFDGFDADDRPITVCG